MFPPLLSSRYEPGKAFGSLCRQRHPLPRPAAGAIALDLAFTLFLTDPADYDGGELVIEDSFGERRVKLPAGDLVLYPATTVHRVEPVTRGVRWAALLRGCSRWWRSDEQRNLLLTMDTAIAEARAALSDDHPSVIALTGAYHNLLRMWAEV